MFLNSDLQPLCKGYARRQGRPGIRNKLLILYTVECSQPISRKIAQWFDETGLVDCLGNEACAFNEVVYRYLKALATHPNIGAVLVVGMGCEEMRGSRLCDAARASGRFADEISIQDCGGTVGSIEAGRVRAAALLDKLSDVPMTDVYWKDLCIGAECGSSDYTSHIAANFLVGAFMDCLVSMGGAGVLGEVTEMVGQKPALLGFAADERAVKELDITYDKMINFCRVTRRFSISHGNFLGGLTTIEEKSAGALMKLGHGPLCGVLKIGQQAPDSGMWIVDDLPDEIPSSDVFRGGDASSMMSLICSGCQLVFLTTGRGHTAGTPVSPVFKITGNAKTFVRMRDDMDFDASLLLTDSASACTREEMTSRLFDRVAAVAAGEKTRGELYGANYVSLPFNNQKKDGVIDRLNY